MYANESTDKQRENLAIKNLNAGEFYISNNENEVIITVLGSCIAVCIFDNYLKKGGMNHFLLPGDFKNLSNAKKYESSKYGLYSMEKLLNEFYKSGSRKKDLEFKVFGGSKLNNTSFETGYNNIKFIKEFIDNDGYNLIAEDVGGNSARKLHFYPTNGTVMLKSIHKENEKDLINLENTFQKKIITELSTDNSELF